MWMYISVTLFINSTLYYVYTQPQMGEMIAEGLVNEVTQAAQQQVMRERERERGSYWLYKQEVRREVEVGA